VLLVLTFFSHSYVGAIVGYADGGAIVSIENCFSDSRVESDGNYVGGLVGMSVATIQLKNVYNLGTVIAGSFAGGIAGYLYVGRIKVINAYNMGTISMPSSSYRGGGLVGYVNSSEDASFENCFNDRIRYWRTLYWRHCGRCWRDLFIDG
jgi:hypothetical protein